MNIIDIIFGIVILFFSFKGFRRGFVAEAIGIISFVLALYYNADYNSYISKIISNLLGIESAFLLRIASFVVFYIVAFLLLKVVSSFFKNIFGGIGVIDNIIGSVALFALSVVILGFVSIGIDKVVPIRSAEDYRLESKLYYPVQNIVKSNIFYLK